MKKILLSAYAVNPYKGSEDGMGWNFICQIARKNKVIVVTRKNNALEIERYIALNQNPLFTNIQFVYFDLPYWMRFWKRGSKGALLYFYLWQFNLPRFIKKQHLAFDIAHNLNFHNDWTFSRLWVFGKPFVWGPIGHHPQIPGNFLRDQYGFKQYFIDKLKYLTKKLIWRFDPFLKATIKNSSAVIVMNTSVAQVIPIGQKNVHLIPSVGSENHDSRRIKSSSRFHILSIGRFIPLKGFDITIRSFAAFYCNLNPEQKSTTKLTLIGKGKFKEKLMALAKTLGVKEAVSFVDWVDRDKLKKFYMESSVFLFPSHEGAGMVVAEALSYGIPVICLDNCGPGEFVDNSCGVKITHGKYNETIKKISQELHNLFTNESKLEQLSAGARKRYENYFEWNAKGDRIQMVYDSLNINNNYSVPKNKIVCVHLLNDYSGSPLVFSEAIRGLVKTGHQVDLFTCGNTKGFLSDLPVNYHTFWYAFYANKYFRLAAFAFSQILLFFKLLKYLRQPVDIYINTILPFGAALAGKLMGKNVIYHLHETSINPPAFKKFLKIIAESTANTAIYVSNYLKKTEPLRGVYSSVIYNALSDEFVNKANAFRLHKTTSKATFKILMICSLKPYKGIFDFIEIAQKMPHISFDLVLNASANVISQYFEKADIPKNLTLYEATKNVHPFYESADLVLNLSHPDQWVETFGMTILEAMCYGIPVIAPPVGGVTELVQQNSNGYLKDVRSKHDLRNTIHQIYADPLLSKRLSDQAVLTANKFSCTTMHEKICEVIEKQVAK